MGEAGEQTKLHLCLQPIPYHLHYRLSGRIRLPVRSEAALDSHGNMNSPVNCVYEGSRLCAPCENHPETIPSSTLP